MRGDFPGLVPNLAGGDGCCRPRGRRAAAGVRAETIRRRVGVTLLHLDVSHRDPQLLSKDLGVGRLVPLPLRFRAKARHHLARGMDADLATIEHFNSQDIEVLGRTSPDDLGEARNPNAHQLAPLPLGGLLPAQLSIPDLVHGEIEGPSIVAAIVFPAED